MLRVFLVEDLQSMCGLMKDLFDSVGGFSVVGVAATEAEANLWLKENAGAWDLAIIDLVLDEGSGFGVIQRAARSAGAGRVLVFSSFATAGIRNHCLRLGAAEVFDKAQTDAFTQWVYAESRREKPAASP
jgi:DNA-binding NarL/FixJ family response regulator